MIKAVSFYMKNINPDVVRHQRLVVNKFSKDIEFEQVLTDKSHADSMTEYMQNTDLDYVIFLDIDAIPLSENSFAVLLSMTDNGKAIAGAPQRSNHLQNNEHVYVAPSIMCISTELYCSIGSPSAAKIKNRGDVAEEWTYAQEQAGGPICLLDVESFDPVPNDRWFLKDGQEFGRNTKYSKDSQILFFHSYQGRFKEQQDRFIQECKKVLW